MSEDLKTFYQMVKATRAGVLDWMDTLPADIYTHEHPDFAFGSLKAIYTHIAGCYLHWIGHCGLGRPKQSYHPETVTELRELFALVDATVEKGLATFTNLDEARTMTLRDGSELQYTQRWLFLHPFTHEFHHKGQALALARVLGHPFPSTADTDLVPLV